MTAIGIVVLAAGVALIWGGITDKAILPQIQQALGNKKPTTTVRFPAVTKAT